ncbi:MAG: hypothetical protein V3V11_07910 [Vicinamibacteria bacterium]
MAHTEIAGNIIGQVWRAQEGAKEITYFIVEGEPKWFRIEYVGERMLDRANFMAEKLVKAAGSGTGVEVGVNYDELTVGDPPGTPSTTFNLVSYIQVPV